MATSKTIGTLAALSALAASCGEVAAFSPPAFLRTQRAATAAAPLFAECTLDGETIRGPITPLGNYVLVQEKDVLTSTEGGIVLPDQSKERACEGEVLAAGPGKLHPHTGVRIVNPITEGMSVLYGEFAGTSMVYNDEQVTMIRDDDVIIYYEGTTMTKANAIPCRDYVLVKTKEQKLETASGIVVAASVTRGDVPCEGTVFKVGEGRMCSKGEFTPSPVKVGETVKFKDYGGNDVKIEGELYSAVRMVDILCSIPQEEDMAP
uniref:20 kDa chaperonin, chloroplastic n=1 Tax=Trieres chinensis TaxID=1514140 RepID=A0A7S1ZF55_TRICV|eukprot:CAMPEP_0183307536 /NCGR_PEP_ID=MMETSP0160_2-20130417/17890_1 /TAXON_ID=2839 ORGANISM="Odontella Sinensis, Strain Grunow 1884" /NCGR_SAMPLE_ID=MMETSP0160_2 /ASSEMBLY_ACC=CAM_ASM_000250 /LENGTH=262 /DNA_ID=CAMNT_0025471143 /DNA_START=29 /DNA_END=817 /DNA_ORIENTATION=+